MNGVVIGLGAAVIGVPLVLPIALLSCPAGLKSAPELR
jgi:hypothetical protein